MATGFSAEVAAAAAAELLRQHQQRQPFDVLPPPWAVASAADAYAVQAAFVRQLESRRGTRTCGYKVALTTPAMRRMVGYHDSISGHLLEDQILDSGSSLRLDDFCHLLLEFEIAFRMGSDVPATSRPWTRDTILPYVACAYPALEVADDRNADYSKLAGSILTLAADNAWNQGLVLGTPNASFTADGLREATGVARIDAEEVGRGTGADVMGHPLDALAWLANHLQQRGLALSAGDLATTGSLVTSKFPARGSTVAFEVSGLGAVTLHVC